ncbi:MAG: large subunit ribosomal protein L19 [Verrucomicrobiales bacterium]|jgi:large subunit ribosomal protein L19
MNVIDKIEKEQMKDDVPTFGPGDTIKVHSRVVEGGKERIQIYQGIVIGRRGSGLNQACTVRKISNSVGVERVFQIHSPKVAQIEVISRGQVRRSKVNFLRDRVGKAASTVRPAKNGWKVKADAQTRTDRAEAKAKKGKRKRAKKAE